MKLTKTPSRAASTLTLCLALLVATTMFAQQLTAPSSEDGKTTKMVSDMIRRYHISRSDIDDATSVKLFDQYIESLDPQKLYFTAEDIKKYEPQKKELDDKVKAGDVRFCYDVFDDYLKRLDSRMNRIHQLIDSDFDFTKDEKLDTDPDDRTWATSEAEINERWRKRIKYDLLTLKVDGADLAEARDRLHKRYRAVSRASTQMENYEKLEMYLSSLSHCFDPHSSYMAPQTLEDFQIQMRLSLEGIGAALRSEDGYTIVASIVPGGAADKDGRLKVGDKIIGVDQGDGEMRDVVEMKLSKVVRFIRGKKGTNVILQVKRAEDSKIEKYELTRQKIELKESAVKGRIINTNERVSNSNMKIGVVHIPSFYRDFGGAQRGEDNFKSTTRDVRKVLNDFNAKGVDAVIVDLRTNGGGALKEAIDVSGLFINEGPVVQVKDQNGNVKSHRDEDAGTTYNGPLVVVCNRLSASASEIFAGVIKDYGRGIIIGDTTTHGKGTVQNVMPVARQLFQFINPENRGALKLTINQFYRVNGESTQERGVPSDIVLPSLIDHMEFGESYLDNALKFDKVEPTEHQQLNFASDQIISNLKSNSQKRVLQDPEFQKVVKEIGKYLKRKEDKTVTLNEAELRKERESDNQDKKKDDEDLNPDKDAPVFKDGFYNDELLQITMDYANLLKDQRTAGKQ